MYNIKEYLTGNNKISRVKIVNDIKSRKLTRRDLEKLVREYEVQSAFIGKVYNNKLDKRRWNQDYLDQLTHRAIAESFNQDFLFYLDDVAEYVSLKKRNHQTFYICCGIAAVGLFLYVIYLK